MERQRSIYGWAFFVARVDAGPQCSPNKSRAVPFFLSTKPVPRMMASGIAPARPQKFPIVLANGDSAFGSTSLVILPSSVVPKSMEIHGFLKSTGVHFAPSLIPAMASSPSISFATISTPVVPDGGVTPATAPVKTKRSAKLCGRSFGGRLPIPIGGVIFFGGTPASRHPSAKALMNSPTWSGESMAATTPVLLTTKSRSSVMLKSACLWHFTSVSRTSSVTDSRVSSVPSSVAPKTVSPGFGGRTSRLIDTVFPRMYDCPVSKSVPVRMHLVVVFPISTEATIKYGLDLYSGTCIPAPWPVAGGATLSTTHGFFEVKRSKKPADIILDNISYWGK